MMGLRIHRDHARRWTNLREHVAQQPGRHGNASRRHWCGLWGPCAHDNGHRSSITSPGRGLFVPSSAIPGSSVGSLYAVQSMIPTASWKGHGARPSDNAVHGRTWTGKAGFAAAVTAPRSHAARPASPSRQYPSRVAAREGYVGMATSGLLIQYHGAACNCMMWESSKNHRSDIDLGNSTSLHTRAREAGP